MWSPGGPGKGEKDGCLQCHLLVFRGVTMGGGFNLCSQLLCIKFGCFQK